MYKRLSKCSVDQLNDLRLNAHYIDKLNKYLPKQKLLLYGKRLSKLKENPTPYKFLNPWFGLKGTDPDYLMETFENDFLENYEYYPYSYDTGFYHYLIKL